MSGNGWHQEPITPRCGDTTEVLRHVARLWGFGVQIESVDSNGNHPVLLHSVPAPAA